MHTHTLLLFSFFFFLCATQHLASSKSFFSSNKNRRILNEPSLPPSQPPNQPPLSPPIVPSSSPNLKHPLSTTTTTNESPFFPFYPPPPPPPPPPPSFSTFAYFPANISSLVLPQSPKTKPSSHKPLSIAITAVACATALAAVSAFVYCQRRKRYAADDKTLGSETSINVFPPNSETANGTRKERHTSSTSSDLHYLGTDRTVINSRGIDGSPDSRKMDSPELQPIPRLPPRPQQHAPPQARVVASSTQASEEHEEFYSPRGSSLGSDENGDELSSNSYSSPSQNQNKIFHEPNTALRLSNASRNEDALPRKLSNASNESRKSVSPSSSAFSLPSSPEKTMHFGSLDQSPRMSSFSDRFKQPDLSSLSLSPTLLSSPETEWNKTSNESSAFPNFVPLRTINNVFDQIATPPPLGPFNRVSPTPPPPPQPPPPPPPLQPQKYWEVPTYSPPELIPPSRPFVLQNQTTKVSTVGLMQSSQNLRRNEKDLKPKLKPLHWDKVRASSGREMVWDHLKSSSFKLNEEMIESLFVVKPKVNTPHSVLPQPSQEERILDPKKSQNIAILLRALNVTVEEVCEALLEGNADTLGTELLESLLKMAPSVEEERKLKEHKDDSPTKLGPAEKFLKAVLDVPFAFKRVEAMLYVVNFEPEMEYLRKSFQIVESACEELRNCRMFLKLLEAVLKTGNRMNVGTIRGEAHAFKLDTLLKLADVKGADGKTTLLHFVVQEIIRLEGARLAGSNQPPSSTLNEDAKCRRLGLQVVSSLSSELANVKKAAAMDSEILSSDVSKLTKGIAYVAEVAKTNKMKESDESSNKFTESMDKFIRMAEEEVPKIEAHERVALSLVKEITEYFHGNLAKEEAHPFRIFMVVRDFLTVLDRVCREVGMINERTMVSSAHKFPVPVNPMLPQPLPGLTGRQQYHSSDDSASP